MNDRTPRQEELLDLALELAREVGIGGLTVRSLAHRAGFTEAALYRHYPSKQALLLALMGRIEERFLPAIRDIALQPDRPARDRLSDVVARHLKTVLAIDGLPIFLLAEAAVSGDHALVDRIRATIGNYLALLERLLAEIPAEERGGRAPQELALVLFGVSAATAIRHRVLPSPELERGITGDLPAFLIDRLTHERGGSAPTDG